LKGTIVENYKDITNYEREKVYDWEIDIDINPSWKIWEMEMKFK
jgi:hypothetical protein